MRKAMAKIHSLGGELAEVTIISETNCNDVVAEYKGKKYTAIFNGFRGLYYVDDIYGAIDKKEA